MNETVEQLRMDLYDAVACGDVTRFQLLEHVFDGDMLSDTDRGKLLQAAVVGGHQEMVATIWPKIKDHLIFVDGVLESDRMLNWPEMMAEMVPYFSQSIIDDAMEPAAAEGLVEVLTVGAPLMSLGARLKTAKKIAQYFDTTPHAGDMLDILIPLLDHGDGLEDKKYQLFQRSIEGNSINAVTYFLSHLDVDARGSAFGWAMVQGKWEAAKTIKEAGMTLTHVQALGLLAREAFSTPEMVANGNPAAPSELVDYLYDISDPDLVAKSMMQQHPMSKWCDSHFGLRWHQEQANKIGAVVDEHLGSNTPSIKPKKM